MKKNYSNIRNTVSYGSKHFKFYINKLLIKIINMKVSCVFWFEQRLVIYNSNTNFESFWKIKPLYKLIHIKYKGYL